MVLVKPLAVLELGQAWLSQQEYRPSIVQLCERQTSVVGRSYTEAAAQGKGCACLSIPHHKVRLRCMVFDECHLLIVSSSYHRCMAQSLWVGNVLIRLQ